MIHFYMQEFSPSGPKQGNKGRGLPEVEIEWPSKAIKNDIAVKNLPCLK